MARTNAFQFARLRPGKFRAIGSVTATAPLLPGEGVKLPFTAASTGFLQLWFCPAGPPAPGTPVRNDLVERYLILKTTADVHVAFGQSGMADADAGDAFLQVTDAMQDFQTVQGDQGLKLIGDVGAGTLYLWLASP